MAKSKKISTPADLKLDPQNANSGTDRGRALLRESVDSCGFGRSVLADKHGVLIAGNKTFETAQAKGADVTVVEATGQELVVVQRTDLDLLADRKARQLAYYDNRTSEVGLHWDRAQVERDHTAGIDLSVAFFDEEIRDITEGIDLNHGPNAVLPSPHLSDPSQAFPETMEARESTSEPRAHHVRVAFENPAAHRRYISFMYQLKARYPHLADPMDRLLTYIEEVEHV